MVTTSSIESVIDAVQDPEVLDFVVQLTKLRYKYLYPKFSTDTDNTFSAVFTQLDKSKHFSVDEFTQVCRSLHATYFGFDEQDHWYPQLYSDYKRQKDTKEAELIQDVLLGSKVVDMGCGRGYLAKSLQDLGFKVTGIDVIKLVNFEMDFVLLPESMDIPLDSKSVDTVIVKNVLHHVSEEQLPQLISEIKRIGSRVVVIEETNHLSGLESNVYQVIGEQTWANKLLSFSTEQRTKIKVLFDFLGNMLIGGAWEMSMANNYKEGDEWRGYFESQGFELIEAQYFGFPDHHLHGYTQLLMVFDQK